MHRLFCRETILSPNDTENNIIEASKCISQKKIITTTASKIARYQRFVKVDTKVFVYSIVVGINLNSKNIFKDVYKTVTDSLNLFQ